MAETRNPGGKREGSGRKAGIPNKATAFIRSLAGEHAEKAIQILVELMEATDTPAAARVSAAKELIERGFGRSGCYADLELDTPLSELVPAQAIGVIGDKVANGKLSIDEGQRLVGIVEARIKAVELAEIEDRLSKIEAVKR